MFLHYLEEESEKKAFLELAKILIISDGKIDIEETKIFDRFLVDLDLPYEKFDSVADTTLFEAIASFDRSSLETKKIVLFELLYLAFGDMDFAEAEEVIINGIINKFNISNSCKLNMLDIIKSLNNLTGKAEKIIFTNN